MTLNCKQLYQQGLSSISKNSNFTFINNIMMSMKVVRYGIDILGLVMAHFW